MHDAQLQTQSRSVVLSRLKCTLNNLTKLKQLPAQQSPGYIGTISKLERLAKPRKD